jgi:L,D-peptidoglycan transpeptidase YkuD (ErfK/YbiS/YcfS/YnhG family)
VSADIAVRRRGAAHVADWGAGQRPCAVGVGDIGEKRREGDGITPVGVWPLRRLLYRADRVAPRTSLPLSPIAPDDGWCDAPGDPSYNRPVMLPYPASAERLWREDALYDLVLVVGFNDAPVVDGKGSAIFLHVAAPDYAPTAGCVALSRADLLEALAMLTADSRLRVEG